jgi:hypothetical protein
MKEILAILFRDPKFWTAVLFLIQTLLFLCVPDFPAQVWEALSAVLVIVFAGFTIKSTRSTRIAARRNK